MDEPHGPHLHLQGVLYAVAEAAWFLLMFLGSYSIEGHIFDYWYTYFSLKNVQGLILGNFDLIDSIE